MFPPARGRPLPPWIVNLLALVLVLGTSGLVAWAINAATPDRRVLTLLTGLLLVTPALLRWNAAWLSLFLFLPWISWMRRVQAALAPGAGGIDRFDLLLLVPDVVTLLAVLGLFMSQRFRRKEAPVIWERWLTVPLIGLVGLTLLEVFNPLMGSTMAGLNGLRVFTLYIGLYWVTAHVCERESQIYAWVTATLISSLVAALYGAYQFFVGLPDYDLLWVYSAQAEHQTVGDRVRIFSTFSFTSTYSHFAMIGICFSWVAWRLRRLSRLTQLLAPLCFAVSSLALALTFVRSAYVGLAVALVAGMVLGGRASRRFPRLVLLFAIGLACVALMPSSSGDAARSESPGASQLVAERLTSIGEGTGNTALSLRFSLWQNQLMLVSGFAPMGVGIGAGSGTRFGGDLWAERTAYTESQFFTALVELGWPGFILFMVVVITGLVYTLRTHERLEDPDQRNLVRLSFMVQCAILITGITGGSVLYTQPGCSYYWSMLGLVTAINRRDRARARAEAASQPALES